MQTMESVEGKSQQAKTYQSNNYSRLRCSPYLEESVGYSREVSGGLIVSAKFKVIYVPNMKVASQTFRTVMEQRFSGELINQNGLRKFLMKHKHELKDYFVFTFVRNPLSHFLSAYSEVDKRASQASNTGKTARRGFLKLKRNTTNEPIRALEALENVQSGQFQGLTSSHLYTQFWKVSRCISVSKVPLVFNYIGKIENATKDWRVIEDILRVPHVPLKKVHTVSTPFKTHSKKIDLNAAQYQPLLGRICDYYRADFDCFDYELPVQCTNA